jgi:cardiolipin synthase
VSEVVDQPLVHLSQSSYYDDLLTAGVRINLFPACLLHAKTISIDSRVVAVGSSNVDLRSFQLNEEVSLLLYDADSIARVEAIQQDYLRDSRRLDLRQWRARPVPRKLAENVARLVNSLL